MTFEEFLTKKKIDLALFQSAEPGLFTEFQNHYLQMGEKSFDHSKKFLFNKLRRAYHLKEEPRPAVKDASAAVKETVEVNEIASQAEPLLSPSVEATVYTPRFRAGGTTKKVEEAESGKRKAESETAEEPKPAYVPRFKSPAAKKEEAESGKLKAETENQDASITNQDSEKAKSAYVPRFKSSGTTNAASPPSSDPVSPTSDIKHQTSDISPPTSDPKPAFKPRFKPGLTGTRSAEPAEEIKEESPADKPKQAYVPRFKAATVKPAEKPKDEEDSSDI